MKRMKQGHFLSPKGEHFLQPGRIDSDGKEKRVRLRKQDKKKETEIG